MELVFWTALLLPACLQRRSHGLKVLLSSPITSGSRCFRMEAWWFQEQNWKTKVSTTALRLIHCWEYPGPVSRHRSPPLVSLTNNSFDQPSLQLKPYTWDIISLHPKARSHPSQCLLYVGWKFKIGDTILVPAHTDTSFYLVATSIIIQKAAEYVCVSLEWMFYSNALGTP